jgi:hypothetical protein
MNPRAVLCQLLLSLARMSAIAASVFFVSPALAGGASTVVTPHNYVFDGNAYGDLESLARALPVHEGEALSFEACVPGSSGLLTAAVQRFADSPSHNLGARCQYARVLDCGTGRDPVDYRAAGAGKSGLARLLPTTLSLKRLSRAGV